MQHMIEVAASQDQGPVQALGSDRANPALGVRIRVGRADRGEDHPRTLRAEHLVEGAGELPVPIVDQEPHLRQAPLKIHGQVPRLLGDPCGVGVIGRLVKNTRLDWSSMNTRTYSVRSQSVSTEKKSHAMIPLA